MVSGAVFKCLLDINKTLLHPETLQLFYKK